MRSRHLSRYANDRASCAGIWLPKINGGFVPQGLALSGNTAWVSGWGRDAKLGHQTCRLMQIDLRTGALLKYTPIIKGYVGRRGPVVCRHGGGVDVNSRGLWLTETDRIWLLDPRRVGTKHQIKRAWRLMDPLRGSMATFGQDQMLVGEFSPRKGAQLDFFNMAEITARGAIELWPEGAPTPGRRLVGAVSSKDLPTKVQGMAYDDTGRLVLARSTSRCGSLVVGSRSRALIPGAEDIEYDGNGSLWVLSETVSLKLLYGGDRPLVPSLVRYDVGKLNKGKRARCLRGW